MSIVMVNTCAGMGSTGKIVDWLAAEAEKAGMDTVTICGKKTENARNAICVQGKAEYYANNLLSRVCGNEGAGAQLHTRRVLKQLENTDVELMHLHNLHGHYINAGMLFDKIKKDNIPVVWTLHDCWAFTGQCPHFTEVQCDKWKTGCNHCTQKNRYPQAYIDRSKRMWETKKRWFTGVENMTIVTPSQWLGDLVKQSFLKEYPVKVIHNGIDLSLFQPTDGHFRQDHDLVDKKIILGVAFDWGHRKGLDVFIALSKRLPENYQIVLVGTNEEVDRTLPSNIISIHRTQNQRELAELYTTADVFVIPTREDNFPTVNLEALACGTPVLTFQTGGSAEMLDETCGIAVPCDDIAALERETIRICEEHPYSAQACVERAKAFEKEAQYAQYIALYKEMIR